MSIGIDYGLGQSNIDKETGIRFGVISQHSLHPEWMFRNETLDEETKFDLPQWEDLEVYP